jgi:alanyl-tRNA synthetase
LSAILQDNKKDSHMLSKQMRQGFTNYFKEKGHAILPSSPVIPFDDPTLLFNNAGMNQFKDIFLGKRGAEFPRAVTSQKCIRAGGKHNDLENVGHTTRHLTFFEMLGNFSFGDYFKEEAIAYAWQVTKEIFQFEEERIWATVYKDDDEAFELWKKYLPEKRIIRFGEKQNFWAMGDVGPCGPCSEILYDRGSHFGEATHPFDDVKEERFLEFWNLVFMQNNKLATGKMELLPKPSIDTGAGLERIIALKMGVNTVFQTDILATLIQEVESISGKKYRAGDEHNNAPFHVIADHMRTLSFAIADGAQPGNMERGYVLRKILRRAVRYGKALGFQKPFLGQLLPSLMHCMAEDYPELHRARGRIEELLTEEEEAFFRTLKRGGNLLQQVMEQAKEKEQVISGEAAFKLKDTYGLPLEEIELIAVDEELTVDKKRFAELEQEAKERSRQGSKKAFQEMDQSIYKEIAKSHATEFVGYLEKKAEAFITTILIEGARVETLEAGQQAAILLNKTPFYAEMGGQVGDTGVLSTQQGVFKVTDTLTPYPGVILHMGYVEKGQFKREEEVTASLDIERRDSIERNHTATHLLHLSLTAVLGEHVQQAGSVVMEDRLRFDFNHHKALSEDEIEKIETLVNCYVRANISLNIYEIPYSEAKENKEIKQFFGDKYGAKVRVVDALVSKELCGGTHTSKTGNIGYFRLIKESSIAKGVRRIEAATGKEAENFALSQESILDEVAKALKCTKAQVKEAVEKLKEESTLAQNKLKELEKEKLFKQAHELISKKGNAPCLAEKVDLSIESAQKLMEVLRSMLPQGAIVLGTEDQGKAFLLCTVGDDLVEKGIFANEIIKDISPWIQGGGGGDKKRAQAGGKNPEGLILSLEAFIKKMA